MHSSDRELGPPLRHFLSTNRQNPRRPPSKRLQAVAGQQQPAYFLGRCFETDLEEDVELYATAAHRV